LGIENVAFLRPVRSNRGKGSVIHQLTKIGNEICPEHNNSKRGRKQVVDFPDDAPDNDMAPPLKKKRILTGTSNVSLAFAIYYSLYCLFYRAIKMNNFLIFDH